MLELIDVVIRKVLLEWASYIIRLFALLLAPATSNFNILVTLARNQHRVKVVIHILIYGNSLLKKHSLFLFLLLRLLPLLLLSLILFVIGLVCLFGRRLDGICKLQLLLFLQLLLLDLEKLMLNLLYEIKLV